MWEYSYDDKQYLIEALHSNIVGQKPEYSYRHVYRYDEFKNLILIESHNWTGSNWQNDWRDVFYYSKLTGVNNNRKEEQNIFIYPNPFHEYLVLYNIPNGLNLSIKIFNNSGKIIYKFDSFSYLGSNQMALDLSELNTGIYFIIIETKHQITSKKIIKKIN